MFGKLDNSITGSHSEREWQELVVAWGWRCFYCARPVHENAEPIQDSLTRDHLIPLFRGGSDDIGNIVPACFNCNRIKGTMTIDEFRAERPVFFTAEQNARRKSIEVDTLRAGKKDSTAPFAVQAVNYLAPKMSMDPTSDPAYWQHRREILAQQVHSLGRRFLEAAGQMQLSLEMPSSPPKPPQTDEGAMTFRGMHVTENKA